MHTRTTLAVGALGSLVAVSLACMEGKSFAFQTKPATQLRGLSEDTPSTLSEHETNFLSVPSNATARENLKFYAAEPHMAGTVGDYNLAVFTRDQMRALGLESEIEPVDVLLSTPNYRSIQLMGTDGSVEFEAKLSEDVLDSDPTSDTVYRNLTFNGYAPSGCASGRLVYANYGRPEDFEALEKMGVSVEGAVVITRYGLCFRGLKAMNAQQRGAVAVIIYSDPMEDGYTAGEVYPKGPWRPESSVQRGSIQFNSLCAGDPARAASNKTTEEICGYSEKDLYPEIPVLPISYGDALPLLQALGGELAPKGFVGALDLAYRTGPSSTDVKVTTNNTFDVAPIWNVITTIPGASAGSDDDRPVVLGNHRDAWVFGAADPNSGSTAMLEVARGLAKLKNNGWVPKRSIILCSWSGEEYGLLGSTAWGEANGESILKNAIAYVNVDVGVSGKVFKTQASPGLAGLVKDVLHHVKDPDTGKPVNDLWDGDVMTLGSGSDYTVFLDHLGIASVDVRFVPNDKYQMYGTYHSIYDSYEWMVTEADPTMQYHVAIAQVWGLLALRLADANVVPFDHVDQASAVYGYVKSVDKSIAESSKMAGKVNLSGLYAAASRYMDAARALDERVKAMADGEGHTANAEMKQLNDKLAFAERKFLSQEGLHRRPWFKHVLQSPGLYLGYAAQVLPGVTQGVDDGDMGVTQNEILKATNCIDAAAAFLSDGLTVDPLAVEV